MSSKLCTKNWLMFFSMTHTAVKYTSQNQRRESNCITSKTARFHFILTTPVCYSPVELPFMHLCVIYISSSLQLERPKKDCARDPRDINLQLPVQSSPISTWNTMSAKPTTSRKISSELQLLLHVVPCHNSSTDRCWYSSVRWNMVTQEVSFNSPAGWVSVYTSQQEISWNVWS